MKKITYTVYDLPYNEFYIEVYPWHNDPDGDEGVDIYLCSNNSFYKKLVTFCAEDEWDDYFMSDIFWNDIKYAVEEYQEEADTLEHMQYNDVMARK